MTTLGKSKTIIISIILISAAVIIYGVLGIRETLNGVSNDLKDYSKEAIEKAYFMGQLDAIEGDIRIKKIDYKTYVWSKSPWTDSIRPIKDTIKLVPQF